MTFQKTVAIIAVVILSLSLFFIAILLMNEKRKKVFPNEIPDCPDYYTIDNNGGCILSKNFSDVSLKEETPACKNPGKIFKTGKEYTGTNGRLKKCKWAKKCGVSWDGITNQNLC